MNKIWFPALIAATVFSASAFADHDWDDDDYRPHHHRKVKHVVEDTVAGHDEIVLMSEA